MSCHVVEFCANANNECWDKLDNNSCDKYSYKGERGEKSIFDEIVKHKAKFGQKRE